MPCYAVPCLALQRLLSPSSFVNPFLDTIRSWEKTISLVYEIVDEWINFTQRKWLYLEGIFVGGDARGQLPLVAEQFDQIDVEYMSVRYRNSISIISFKMFKCSNDSNNLFLMRTFSLEF